MEQMEVMMWLSVIEMAHKGEASAKEHLEQENRLRQESGRPTVEQEIIEMVDRLKKQGGQAR